MAVLMFSTTYRNRRMEAPRSSVHGRTQNQRREVRHGWPFGCFRRRTATGEWRLHGAAFMDERKTNVEKSGMDGRSGVFDDVPQQANGGPTEERSWTNAKPTSRSQAWMAVRVFSISKRCRRMEAQPGSVHGRTHTYAVKELPHPQVVLAFGLWITNCAPESSST